MLKVWDIGALGEGRARHGLHRKPAPVVCMTAVRARGWLVVGLINTATRRYALQVQDMKEPHEVLATVSLEDAFVLLSVSDDGRTLAAGGSDGTVRVYDFAAASEALARQQALKALAPIASLAGHSKPVSSITLFPDGRFLAASAMDSKIIVWDLQTAKQAFRLQAAAGEQFASAAAVHGGRELAAAIADGRVRVWEAVR